MLFLFGSVLIIEVCIFRIPLETILKHIDLPKMVEVFSDEYAFESKDVSSTLSHLKQLKDHYPENFKEYMEELQRYLFQLDYSEYPVAIQNISYLFLFAGHQHIRQDFLSSITTNFPFTSISFEEVREDLLLGILSNYYSIDSHYHLNIELFTLFSDLFQIDKEKDFMKALAFVEKASQSMDVEWWWEALLKVLFTKFSGFSQEIDTQIVSIANELTGLTLSKEVWKHLPSFSDYQGHSILDYDAKQ